MNLAKITSRADEYFSMNLAKKNFKGRLGGILVETFKKASFSRGRMHKKLVFN